MEPGLKDRSPLARAAPRTAYWLLEAAQTFCQCIWDTYGRFPATVDPMPTLLWLQAIRDHAKNWHAGGGEVGR